MLTEVDRKSHSYLLGVAESEIKDYHETLAGLVRCVKDDLERLPNGYMARRYYDHAVALLEKNAPVSSQNRVETK